MAAAATAAWSDSNSSSLPPLPDLIPIRRSPAGVYGGIFTANTTRPCDEEQDDKSERTFRSHGSASRPSDGARDRLSPQSERDVYISLTRGRGRDAALHPPAPADVDAPIDYDERSRDINEATPATPTRRRRHVKLNQKHRKSDRRRREHRVDRHLKRSISCSTTSSTTSSASLASSRRESRYGRQNSVSASVSSVKSELVEFVSPRVNPIFLWVKQEDTTIVEVRCEDYDKRNRIRLTKTPSGWRAIPRTESLCPPTASDLSGQQADTKSPRHRRASKHKHKKKRKHTPTRLQNVELDPCSPRHKELQDERSRSPSWSLPVNIETHIPSHTIPVLVKGSETVTASVSAAAEHSTLPRRDETSIASVPLQSVAEQSLSLLSVPPGAFSSVAGVTAPAHRSALENLLAVAELEFNHQEAIEHGTDTKSYHNYQSIEPSAASPAEGRYYDTEPNDRQLGGDSFPVFESKDLFEPHHGYIVGEDVHVDEEDNTLNPHDLLDSLVGRDCDDNHVSAEDAEKLREYVDKIAEQVGLAGKLAEDIEEYADITYDKNSCDDKVPSEISEFDEKVDDNIEYGDKLVESVDDYDDDDDDMMDNEPVSDIIDRLGESLASPKSSTVTKIISFHEEESICGTDLFGSSDSYEPNNNTEMPSDENANNFKEAMADEGIIKSTDKYVTLEDLQPTDLCIKKTHAEEVSCEPKITNIETEASSDDELPKDLSCPKRTKLNTPSPKPLENRPSSRNSDTIQSPQPSGIPAVPPSPDLFPNVSSKSTGGRSMFLENLLLSPSPKMTFPNEVRPRSQKEPLDLGKCRKSASPTVSCSEEAKTTSNSIEGEPEAKRIKLEAVQNAVVSNTSREKMRDGKKTDRFIDILGSVSEPDALAQLRMLMSNPEWSVPDPLLVPKDRLNSILTSPAREIPLLLALRPELRLPEAFAYPSILQDPDILVISLGQLESIIKKQVYQAAKTSQDKSKKAEETVKLNLDIQKYQQQKLLEAQLKQMGASTARNGNLCSDIDMATTAAFNQMMWLPYLNQLEAASMCGNRQEMLKAFANNYPSQMDMQVMQSRFMQPFQMASPLDYGNLEMAMWQQSMAQANNTNMQRVIKNNAHPEQQFMNGFNVEHPANPQLMFPHNTNSSGKKVNGANNKLHSARTSPIAHGFQQQRMNNFSAASNFPQYPSSRQMPNIQIPHYNMMPVHSKNQRVAQQASPRGGQTPKQLMSPNFMPNPNRKQHPNFTGSYAQCDPKREVLNKKSQQQIDLKPRVTCKSLLNLLQPAKVTSQENKKSADYPKMSSLMQMPTLSTPAIDLTGFKPTEAPKLKVKQHLVDPSLPRRLLKHEEIPEVGSTTAAIDDVTSVTGQDAQTHLWHPLFGNQKNYNSPWNWTTVTVNGE